MYSIHGPFLWFKNNISQSCFTFVYASVNWSEIRSILVDTNTRLLVSSGFIFNEGTYMSLIQGSLKVVLWKHMH